MIIVMVATINNNNDSFTKHRPHFGQVGACIIFIFYSILGKIYV